MTTRILTKNQTIFWVTLGVILLLSTIAGLADIQFHWPQASGWSRAKLVAQSSLRESAPMTTDDEGNIYLLFFPQNGSNLSANLLALDRFGNERWQQTLAQNLNTPTQPRLLWHNGELINLWVEDEAVLQTNVTKSGEIVGETAVLDFPLPIEQYAAVSSLDGLHIWAGGNRSEASIYAMTDAQTPQLIDPEGIAPTLQLDEMGHLHAIWLRRVSGTNFSIVYGGTAAGDSWLDAPIEIQQVRSGSSVRLRGPWFMVEEDLGYVAWASDFLSGLSAGQSLSQFISFELVPDTAVSTPNSFQIAYGRQQAYQSVSTELPTNNRIVLSEQRRIHASPLEGQPIVSAETAAHEGIIALRASVEYLKQREASQIALYFFNDGEPNGYQLLSFSPAGSIQPSVILNGNGDLLVSWLERGQSSGYNIYLASTSPELQQAFAGLTLQDFGLFILESAFGMFQSITFTPFSLILWATVPMIILLITHWFRRNVKSWHDPAFLLSLGTAVFIFWYAKFFTLQPAIHYVPFSAWIPAIPTWMDIPLRIFVPLGITLFAASTAWRLSFKRKQDSIYLLFFLYAGLDTLLFMSVYGGILYDAL